jgi:Uma2 family endonuclease
MPKITALSQLDLEKTYSYADYLTWQLSEIVELFKGKISAMAPAPNVSHQRIELKLTLEIGNYLKGKRCEVFPAPFDVRLYDRKKSILENKEIQTVVQPDLCVVCNPDFLDVQGCNGAPDWIIEILSKGNSKREMQTKYALYQEAGVTEYWIVYPNDCAIHQFVLNESGRYELLNMFTDDDIVIPHLFPDLAIKLDDIF